MQLEGTGKYWLMKAEPDSRLVKGKDVKFSIDDLESVECTPWEGVRNYEARNFMKEMSLGDKVLFYHSNCKNPGIAGFAEVSKEAYPDYTAWDSAHPYFDEKSNKDTPRWFMVDVKFISRAQHFVPLSLLRHLADLPSATPPEAVSYVGRDGINVIKAMPLITRGRLSVQRVPTECWNVIQLLAEQGGWDDMSFEKKLAKGRAGRVADRQRIRLSGEQRGEGVRDDTAKQPRGQRVSDTNMKVGRKRKGPVSVSPESGERPHRKSLRSKK